MAEGPIDVVAFVRILVDKVPEAIPHVKVLMEQSRLEPGVTRYDVYADIKEPGTYVFLETYDSLDVLKKHQGTEHFKKTIETCTPWFSAPVEIRVLKKAL